MGNTEKKRINRKNTGGRTAAGTAAAFLISLIYFIVCAFFLFFAVAGAPLAHWYKETFHTSFREIIYTYDMGLKGANVSFLLEALASISSYLILFAVIFVLIITANIAVHRFIQKKGGAHPAAAKSIFSIAVLAIVIACSIPSFQYIDRLLKVSTFLKSRYVYSDLYEKEYVSPEDASITASSPKRNVIILYLESMETTYTTEELGGVFGRNAIPNLTKLAQENVSFGDRTGKELRGIHNPVGTTWTTGALLASSSGVPFAFPVGKNAMGADGEFAPGLDTLGDFLKREGYYQEFLCGSDAEFGGRLQFYKDHGSYNIFDYNTALKKGYVKPEEKVWWGLEDHKMYEIAKDELIRISKEDKPFNFTLLTVDTHHVGGYRCKWCPNKYKNELSNIIACADKQAYDFVEWCKEQEFYSNTTIVILGDHPRMDNLMVKKAARFDRCTYNCFINPIQNGQTDQNRLAVTMDLFPTIISSMGYTIDGDRLGLGTNLFSSKPTLAEEMTYPVLNDELEKNSHYYMDNFR